MYRRAKFRTVSQRGFAVLVDEFPQVVVEQLQSFSVLLRGLNRAGKDDGGLPGAACVVMAMLDIAARNQSGGSNVLSGPSTGGGKNVVGSASR